MASNFVFQQIATALTRGWTWRRRVKVVILAWPVLFFAATVLFAIEGALFVVRSVAVEGTVVERYEWPGETIFDRGRTNYEPIFSYENAGETLRASVGSSHASFNIPIGKTATIRAIPGNRGNVRIDTWQGLWFVPAVLALFTAVVFAIALPLWLGVRRLFDWKTQ